MVHLSLRCLEIIVVFLVVAPVEEQMELEYLTSHVINPLTQNTSNRGTRWIGGITSSRVVDAYFSARILKGNMYACE